MSETRRPLFRPVALLVSVRASRTVTCRPGSKGFSRSALVTLQPVIPEPMTAISVVDCRVEDWTLETEGCGGSCQNEMVGSGRGSCGSAIIRDLSSCLYSRMCVIC